MDMQVLNEQHANLALISSKFAALLDENLLLDKISEVEAQLNDLTNGLLAHLFAEDKLLYPFLVKSDDKKIVETSERFQASMGGIKQVYEDYVEKWPKEQIIAYPAIFIKESKGIIAALHDRINKEENELFPLVT